MQTPHPQLRRSHPALGCDSFQKSLLSILAKLLSVISAEVSMRVDPTLLLPAPPLVMQWGCVFLPGMLPQLGISALSGSGECWNLGLGTKPRQQMGWGAAECHRGLVCVPSFLLSSPKDAVLDQPLSHRWDPKFPFPNSPFAVRTDKLQCSLKKNKSSRPSSDQVQLPGWT